MSACLLPAFEPPSLVVDAKGKQRNNSRKQRTMARAGTGMDTNEFSFF